MLFSGGVIDMSESLVLYNKAKVWPLSMLCLCMFDAPSNLYDHIAPFACLWVTH
jgi:hypothetical protein